MKKYYIIGGIILAGLIIFWGTRKPGCDVYVGGICPYPNNFQKLFQKQTPSASNNWGCPKGKFPVWGIAGQLMAGECSDTIIES